MRVMFQTDPHWCQNSSIVRSRGTKYSTRLENLIRSVNWSENLAWEQGCSVIICGGDFFDSSVLNSEEISALKELQVAPISHVFITGNHESNISNLQFSTLNVFQLHNNSVIFDSPTQYFMDDNKTLEFCFLPYISEDERKPIESYFGPKTSKRIIFSHNDIKDVQYGKFLSTTGFKIDDIESNCDLYMNGHIHHCGYVTKKIINGGNLTGQNFTEDTYNFSHSVQIIDTDTLEVKFYTNPYAFNFYKVDCTSCSSIEDIDTELSRLKSNAVVTIKLYSRFLDATRSLIESKYKDLILEKKFIVEQETTDDVIESDAAFATIDHLKQFEQYVFSDIGSNDIIKEELMRVLS